MAKRSREDWSDIRAKREAGASWGELSKEYGVHKSQLSLKAKLEKWSDPKDSAEIVARRAIEKVNGLTDTRDPKKRAEQIDAAAEKASEILKRQQGETMAVRERLYAGLKGTKDATTRDDKRLAFEDLKAAKISSECMAIIHAMERKAHALDRVSSTPAGPVVRHVLEVPDNDSGL